FSRATPDPFDDAAVRVQLLDSLETYLGRYAHWNLSERISGHSVYWANFLARNLETETLSRALQRLPLPLPVSRGRAWTTSEWVEEYLQSGTAEARMEELPIEFQERLRQIPAAFDLPGGNLWEFIRQESNTVTLAPQILPKELGTMNPITGSILLAPLTKQRASISAYLSVLAHEAYHVYSFRQGFPESRSAQLLEERNAFLVSTYVLVTTLADDGGSTRTFQDPNATLMIQRCQFLSSQ